MFYICDVTDKIYNLQLNFKFSEMIRLEVQILLVEAKQIRIRLTVRHKTEKKKVST